MILCCLYCRPKPCIADVEPRLQEALKIPVTLPSVLLLEEAFFKAKDWVEQMQELTSRQRHPYLEQLEALMNKAKHIQLGLEPSWGNLERIIDGARAWRERAAKTFMKKNTPAGLQLLDILSPRDDPLNSRGVRINKKDEISVVSIHILYIILCDKNIKNKIELKNLLLRRSVVTHGYGLDS